MNCLRKSLHIYPEHLRNFPIPLVEKNMQSPVITLVNQILTAKNENPAADTSDLETQIDRLVYNLYGLTADEIEKSIPAGCYQKKYKI